MSDEADEETRWPSPPHPDSPQAVLDDLAAAGHFQPLPWATDEDVAAERRARQAKTDGDPT
ncbi:hypothetical protein [Amycolatopsis magusensis]|uniref:hypothetical protein n=1 Tax=Amycolatopsis magusensis TaxID=882444 RepID=UPI003C2D01FE